MFSVAYDVRQLGVLDVGLHAQQMVESLVAFGCLGSLVGWQHHGELGGQPVGVYHLALGVSGMNAYALYRYLGRSGVEVLELEVAEVAAVHCVRPLAPELLNVEVVGPHAYLLVRVESHAYVAVLHLVVVAQPAHGLNNLGNAGLVVGAEQGVAVGHDNVLALVGKQFGKFFR